MPPAGGSHGAHGFGGPGPGIHGGGPRGGPPGGGHPGGRAGPMSRSGGMFSGAAHVAFGGQGIFGHIFGTRATANTGTYYDSPEERYVAEYKTRRLKVMSQSQQPSNPSTTPNTPDYPDFLMDSRAYLGNRYLLILAALLISMNVVANVLGAQMWRLWIIPLDCGIFVYPIVYVCLDVLNEVYRRDITNQVVGITCIVNLLSIAAFWGAGFAIKHSNPGVDSTAALAAFGLSARVFFASTVAFCFSSINVNNFLYEKLRRGSKPCTIGQSSFWSSFVSHVADSFLFTIIAFYGRANWNLLFYQFIGSMIVAWILEALCNPFKVAIASKLGPIVNG